MCAFVVDFILASTRGRLTLPEKLGSRVEQRFNFVDSLMLGEICAPVRSFPGDFCPFANALRKHCLENCCGVSAKACGTVSKQSL